MVRIKIYIILIIIVLCLNTISSSSDEFDKIANKYVNIENSYNDYLKEIMISDKFSFDIALYAPIREIYKINLSNPLYYVIACNFAQWTINKLFHGILGVTPLFYQRELTDYDEYEHEYTEQFKSSVDKIEHTINEFVLRFIYILYKFFELNPNSTYYIDNSVLKTFISLKVKMMFISQNEQNTSSHDNIIRIFIKEMNTLQQFMSVNCSDRQIIYKNKKITLDTQVYGYWIQFYDSVYHEYNNKKISEQMVNDFLNKIQIFNLYSAEEPKLNCSLAQLLLENITLSSPKDHITFDISNAKLKITDTEMILINNLLNQVKVSYDIKKLFWYQDSVLSAIIKLIYSKILNILKQGNSLSEIIINKIEEINKLVINHYNNLPTYLVEGFTLLTKVKNTKTNVEDLLFKTLNTYHDSFNIILANENNTSTTYVEQNLNDFIYLETFLDKIINNFDDFQCFNQSFKFLRDEQNKYYIPFIEKKNTIFHINPTIVDDQSNQNCYFAINIYSICYHATTILNRISDDISSDKTFMDKLQKTIQNIRDYLVIILKTKTSNFDLLEMSYNIVTILVNLPEKSVAVPLFPFRRALSVIMTELNNYGLKYCISLKFDFLLFNNIDFMNFPNYSNNTNNNEETMLTIIQNIIDTHDKDNLVIQQIETNDYNYLNVKFLYDNFIIKSKLIKLYNTNIILYWNGRKQTVKDIYKESMNIVLNPKLVYAHYDIYFKFHIGVLYVKLKNILDSHNIFQIKNKFSLIDEKYLNEFDFTYSIPIELHHLISEIKSFLQLHNAIPIMQKNNKSLNTDNIEKKLKEKCENIEQQFKKYNIFFIFKKSIINTTSLHIELYHLLDPFKLIINEFKEKVTTFMHYFSTFKRQPITVEN